MIEIDGSHGEGGGQVLRTSLALSIVTGKPFRLFNIRAGRKNPGLQSQHLACVRAAQAVSGAATSGDKQGSRTLLFEPGPVRAGNYSFDVMSAGSASLVLQTLWTPLLTADAASTVSVSGGTHNPWAPPYEFLERAFLPLMTRMGVSAKLALLRPGVYPAGGGTLKLNVKRWEDPRPLELLTRVSAPALSAQALLCNLDNQIGERELDEVRQRLENLRHGTIRQLDALGRGNAVMIIAECDGYSEVFTAFGWKGKRAEIVAREAAVETERWLNAGVPVGEHLADQLLLPMALGAGGRFRTLEPSGHTRTNIETIRQFLDVRITCEQSGDAWTISVES